MYFSGFPLKHWQRANNNSFIVETRFIRKRCSSNFSDVYRIAYHVDMNTTLARHEHLSSLSPTISNDRSARSSYAPLQKPLRKLNIADIRVQNALIRYGFRASARAIQNLIQHSFRWYENFISLFVCLFVCLALDDCSKQVRY